MKDAEGNILCDDESVLNRWRTDFENLFKPPNDNDSAQQEFMEHIISDNAERESKTLPEVKMIL